MPNAPERVLSFADALSVVLEHAGSVRARPLAETPELTEAAGRVLAAPVAAERDQPPFDRSTRDGYAVRAAEVRTALRIAGTLRAGQRPDAAALRSGEALEIMTGAPVPSGADAVLMLEHAVLTGDTVSVLEGRMLAAGENVVRRGTEAMAGAELVPAGRRLGAAEIALAASCGLRRLTVYEAPKVAIVATGDELVELDATPEPWQIRNSNSYALKALVTAEGAFGGRLAMARDTLQDLRERIAQGSLWDLLLLSGGVSMGKYDLVEQVLREFGAEFFFTGTLIQPGKPLVFGRVPKGGQEAASRKQEAGNSESVERRTHNPTGWTYFFGLPGNPVSTEVCFRLFVAPLLRALAGQTELAPRFVEARLTHEVRGGSRVTRFLPAVLSSDWQSATVSLVPWQGSGDLAANARANCFAVLPLGPESFSAGTALRVLLR